MSQKTLSLLKDIISLNSNELDGITSDDLEFIKNLSVKKYVELDEHELKNIFEYIQKAKMVKLTKEESEYLSPKEYSIGSRIPVKIIRYEGAKKGQFGNTHEIRILNTAEQNPMKLKRLLTLFKSDFNEFIDKFGDDSDNWEGKKFILEVVQYTNSKNEVKSKFDFILD